MVGHHSSGRWSARTHHGAVPGLRDGLGEAAKRSVRVAMFGSVRGRRAGVVQPSGTAASGTRPQGAAHAVPRPAGTDGRDRSPGSPLHRADGTSFARRRAAGIPPACGRGRTRPRATTGYAPPAVHAAGAVAGGGTAGAACGPGTGESGIPVPLSARNGIRPACRKRKPPPSHSESAVTKWAAARRSRETATSGRGEHSNYTGASVMSPRRYSGLTKGFLSPLNERLISSL